MSWYHIPGNEQDVAISTRVRFARNIREYPFPSRLDAPRAREMTNRVGEILEKNGFIRTDFADISRATAQSLVEKHFASPAFVRESLPHSLFLNDPCNLSVMVCEEDHLRIQCILSGLSLRDAYEGSSKIETLLDNGFELAFDERWGYLSGCPSNLGTAMRASVMLSLPMLTLRGRMEALSLQLGQTGLLLRGLYGEGTSPAGCLYQVSNRVTMGITEEEILSRLEEATGALIEAERRARDNVTGRELDELTDRVSRAAGLLRHAHMLSAGEMLQLLSQVRLGAAMGILRDVRVEHLTTLVVEAMPATLTLSADVPPKTDTERDILRARMVRERIFGA